MRGPIDYIIVGFEGKKIDGSVLRALEDPITKGVISLIDLSAVAKDGQGNVTTLALTEIDDENIVGFADKYLADKKGHITDEDISEVAELLENNTMAGLLIVEHLWAKPLKKALIDANGILIAEGRIHPEAAVELNEEV